MTSLKKIVFLLVLVISLGSLGLSQIIYDPYYGENKVLYQKFNWKTYSTEHFQIFFYVDNEQILKNIAETAESAYRKISEELKHELSEPVPLIL